MNNHFKFKIHLLSLLTMVSIGVLSTHAGKAIRVSAGIWVDDQVYDVIATTAIFKGTPPKQSTDVIVRFDLSGLNGQLSVAEAAPGDRDYNGGRWHVYIGVFTDAGKAALDADNDGFIDAQITNDSVMLDYIEAGYIVLVDTGVYFECPLLRSH